MRPVWDLAYVSSEQNQANGTAVGRKSTYQALNRLTFIAPGGLNIPGGSFWDSSPRNTGTWTIALCEKTGDMKKKLLITEGKKHGQPVLWLQFTYDERMIRRAKDLGGRWDAHVGGWWLSYAPDLKKRVHKAFYDCTRVERRGPMKEELSKPVRAKTGRKIGVRNLSKADKQHLRDYVKFLRGKVLSENTVKVYYFHMLDFFIYLKGKPTEAINNRDVELFREDVCLKRRYAISTHRQVISALKQFKAYYPECKIDELELERPAKQKFLPTVLSQEEVVRLLQATKNIKHRTILALLYSSGLRIGELLSLELGDIDTTRRQIFVRRGKGRKDRYVLMAESFGLLFQNYMMTYRPLKYFVEGNSPGSPYTGSSVRSFLRVSVRLAGIKKHVTPHTLRHSYATHLLEQGVDLRYIQTLLGHSKPETTMIYTHVATKDIMQISSPLDVAIKKLSSNNNDPTPAPNRAPS